MAKIILIISGGSTMGKTTIANKLKANEGFSLYRPLTTRESREDEIYFQYRHVSKELFVKEIENNSFFFHDFLFNNYYGILKDINQFIESNSKCLFIIPSWRMADLIDCIGRDVIAFHIVSTQTDTARQRLLDRSNINEEEINQRIVDIKKQSKIRNEKAIRIENSETIEGIYDTIIFKTKEHFNGTK